jgi:hypothetical protein
LHRAWLALQNDAQRQTERPGVSRHALARRPTCAAWLRAATNRLAMRVIYS